MTDVQKQPSEAWPMGSILAGDQCQALPPKGKIQQMCLVRADHVAAERPHQNYGGCIWFDLDAPASGPSVAVDDGS